MKQTMKRTTAVVLSCVLLLALLVSFASCTEDKPKDLWADALYTEDTTLGEGAKTVTVEVEASERTVVFTIKTDAETVGEALVATSLLEGEMGDYGLYVKRVNGILADYDVDGTYWALYKNGEYMMTGVDSTPIKGGEHFALVRTK